MTEIRLAIRRLTSRRAAMAISVLTLAIAIGAGAATWSLLSAVLLHPLPVRDSGRLAMVGAVQNAGARGPGQSGLIYPYYAHVAGAGVFESTAGLWLSPVPLPTGVQRPPETTPMMIGLGAGLLLSYLGANVIRAFLFRIQPLDPATLAGVAALILLLVIGVSMPPALRAARVDLAEVLRAE